MSETINTVLAYLTSLGIIGAGIGWIVAGLHSALFIGIGAVSIGVGVASLANEIEHRAH